MAHGIHPILPFDLTKATFLVPKLDSPLSCIDLLAIRARQLEKRDSDLATIHERVLKAAIRLLHSSRRTTRILSSTTIFHQDPSFLRVTLALRPTFLAKQSHDISVHSSSYAATETVLTFSLNSMGLSTSYPLLPFVSYPTTHDPALEFP